MEKQIERLPDAEFAVMAVIWENEFPISTKEVLYHLKNEEGKDWSVSTLQTLLTRLVGRGFLSPTKSGREKCYSPLISRGRYRELETEWFLSKNFKSSVTGLVAAMVEKNKLSEKELCELREILEKGERHD